MSYRAAFAHPPSDDVASDGRYADEAWMKMSVMLFAYGIAPHDCICKMFGGARVLANESVNIGGRNIESVRMLLQRCGSIISKEHVGGIGHRESRLDIATVTTGCVTARCNYAG